MRHRLRRFVRRKSSSLSVFRPQLFGFYRSTDSGCYRKAKMNILRFFRSVSPAQGRGPSRLSAGGAAPAFRRTEGCARLSVYPCPKENRNLPNGGRRGGFVLAPRRRSVRARSARPPDDIQHAPVQILLPTQKKIHSPADRRESVFCLITKKRYFRRFRVGI